MTAENKCPECSQPIHWSEQFGCWVHHTAAGIVNCPDPFAIDHLPAPEETDLDPLSWSMKTCPRCLAERRASTFAGGVCAPCSVTPEGTTGDEWIRREFAAHAQAGVEAIAEASK